MNAGRRVTSPAVAEQEILRAVREVRFGPVEVVILDGRVVQIERKEKMRIVGHGVPHRTSGGPETPTEPSGTGRPDPGQP